MLRPVCTAPESFMHFNGPGQSKRFLTLAYCSRFMLTCFYLILAGACRVADSPGQRATRFTRRVRIGYDEDS